MLKLDFLRFKYSFCDEFWFKMILGETRLVRNNCLIIVRKVNVTVAQGSL